MKLWDWIRYNFMIVAIILLFLWFIVIWIAFVNGRLTPEVFGAYALFGTALGTGTLAFATFIMARTNSQLTKLTRLSLEKPLIGEIIVDTIEPVERQMEADAEAIDAEGVYLYDIALSHLPKENFPRTLYDIRAPYLRGIFVHYPHYRELVRRYSEFGNYLSGFAENVSKAQQLVEQILGQIEACLSAEGFAKIISDFPSDSKIPLKYLPFWELLAASGRTVTRPDYDRYHLWSTWVDAFWQKYKGAIMAAIDSTKARTLVKELDGVLRDCEAVLEVKTERLSDVKQDLKAKYMFTEDELKSLRERRVAKVY